MLVPRGSCLVVFLSLRSPGDDAEYEALAERMAELVQGQRGFLGSVSVRDPQTRQGITAASFSSEADALAWKRVSEHQVAQQVGRERLYSDYHVIVTEVRRAYRP